MRELEPIASEIEEAIGVLSLLIARLLPLTLLPPFGIRTSGMGLRLALLVALIGGLYPIAALHHVIPRGSVGWLVALLSEVAIGLGVALSGAIPFFVMEHAGRLIETLKGAQGEAFLLRGEGAPLLGSAFEVIAIGLFAVAGGYRVFFRAIAEGMVHRPLGSGVLRPSLFWGVAENLCLIVTQGVALSAPIIFSLALTEFSFALLSKGASQFPLQGFFGMLRNFFALVMLWLGLPLIFDLGMEQMEESLKALLALASLGT
ncbi:MAG: flagellar biosynthetic protein FliR [Sandaracinaceae bacterium]|nr:flagellar biosynthetic protein FliR [Sandaracinaceae bacterium]